MKHSSITTHEIERLTKVYLSYHDSRSMQTQWSWANSGNQAIYQERQQTMRMLLDAEGLLPLTGRRVLEVGCASGEVLMTLPKLGAQLQDLHGVDLIAQRIRIAQKRYPEVDFHVANAEALSYLDAQFDIVVLFTVFSSILDHVMAAHVAGEVSRVLKPGGAILWYDFRYSNPRNPNVRGMTMSAIRAIFPGLALKLRSTTLLPPLARRLGRATPVLYPLLVRIPLLRTHYQGVLVKRHHE